jgi:quercetin dioxygenase-like cupin family protein
MASNSGYVVVPFGDREWEKRTEDNWPPLVRRLHVDRERDMTMVIVWYGRGLVEPRHIHNGTHAAWVLIGTCMMDGQQIGPWDIVYGPGRVPHGPLHYEKGCMLFGTLAGGALHTAVGEEMQPPPSDGLPTHLVVEQEKTWEPMPWPGGGWAGQQKLMVSDPAREYSARLVRWPAGSTSPRHAHAGAHSAVILSGSAVVDGQTLRPWDFLYATGDQPPGPIAFPEECTIAVSAHGDLTPRLAD